MSLPRLAAWCARHRRLVLLLWAAVLVGGVLSAPALFGRLSGDVGDVDGRESARASALLWAAAPSGDTIAAVLDGRPAEELRPEVDRLAAEVAALPGVASVVTPWSGGDAGLVATDGRAVAVAVTFEPTPAGDAAVDDAAALLRDADAPRAVVGGGPLQDDEMDEQAASDLARAELISMPVALALMVVLFGGVVAAGIPVVVALAGVAATLGALLLATAVADVSVYAVNVVTMLGLGLAVDYGLLLVSRFREEKALADDDTALRRTFATAGRTVTFSGLTVAAALSGLLVFPDDFLRSMGLAGLAVVLLDLVAALTLVPALLGAWGRRIRPAPARAPGRGFARLTRAVRRRPALVVVAVGGVLVLAATPFLGVRFADPDARSLPEASSSRQLAELAEERFATAADVDPVTVVPSPLTAAETAALADRLAGLDGVRAVSVRTGTPGLTVLDVVPDGDSQGPVAMRLVDDVRALGTGALVTGDAAALADYQDALAERLPWMLAVIAVATTVLLFLFTGSLVVPLKALALGALSLGASFGALVWVFQDGHLGALVGTEALGSLSITTPVIVLAIAFGLSMDYEVFLLGRIAEEHRRTGDSDLSVERGLQQTGRIVTAAAALIIVVFAGFVAGGFSPIKQVGLGLALAVLVDTTLVRLLLLPAVMTLMGRRNWWAPRPLRRLHDRLGLTEEAPAAVPAPRAVDPADSPAPAPVPA